MALSLRGIVHQRYGGFLPGGFSVRNDVLSIAKYDVGEVRYTIVGAGGDVSLLKLLTALEQPVPSVNLTGVWQAGNNAYYYLRQEANGTLWWVGFSVDPDPTELNATHGLQEGLSYTSVFQGQMGGTIIEGVWVDVPRGERLNTGRLTLQFTPFAYPTRLSKIASSGDGFEESTWGLQHPFPNSDTIDGIFTGIHKNDGSSLERNLKPYKDSAAVFCLVMPDPDFPDDKRGNPNIPQWHLNYPTGVDRSFEHFLCHVDGNSYDGDLNMHIQLLPQLYGASSTFWDQSNGWNPNHDPQIIQEKLKYNPEGENVLHLEVIMFGRGASCGDVALYNESPALPGWQEQNGNSVLLNGRPINGHVVSGDNVPGQNEFYGQTLVDPKYEIVAGKTLLRVTGVVVLDCGHYDFPDFTPCYDENKAIALAKFNQEIHPVYAIDIVNATSSDDLSGTWSDDEGRTFYLRQFGDNTLWGLGMSPFGWFPGRVWLGDLSFARVFQGTIQPDQSVTVHWVDLPTGGGYNTGSMTLRTAGPGDESLFGGTICRFVTWSDSPAVQRWTKLYDIPAPV